MTPVGFNSSWITQSPWSCCISQVHGAAHPKPACAQSHVAASHALPSPCCCDSGNQSLPVCKLSSFYQSLGPSTGWRGEDTGCFVVQAGWKEGDGMRPKKRPQATAGFIESTKCHTAHVNPPILEMGKLRQGVTREIARLRDLKNLPNLPNLF